MKSFEKSEVSWSFAKFIGESVAILLSNYPFIKGRSRIVQAYGKRFTMKNGYIARLFNGNKIELHPTQFVSKSILLFGVFEPQEAFWFDKTVKPGMTVIDIGANIGQYTLLAAERIGNSGRVISFEPADDNFDILQRNVEMNGFGDRVQLIKNAVGSSIGICEFVLATDGGSNSIYQKSTNQSTVKRINVPCVTLDSIFMSQDFDRVDLIKIDAEGADFEVIKGAQKTLKKYHPVLFVEFAERVLIKFGTTPIEMLRFLRQLGYEAHIFTRGGLRLLRDGDDISNCNICFFYKKVSLSK